MRIIKGLLLKPVLRLLNWLLKHEGNSLIIGGPMGWSWQNTIDDAHHGIRGSNLHADSHARQHNHSVSADGSPIALEGVPNLPASKITSGILSLDRIPTPLTGKDADTVDGQHRVLNINADHTHLSSGDQGGTLSASAITSGTFPVSRGGTGLSSIAAGGILYASAADTLSRIAPTAANQVLRSTAANALQIAALASVDIPNLDLSKITTGWEYQGFSNLLLNASFELYENNFAPAYWTRSHANVVVSSEAGFIDTHALKITSTVGAGVYAQQYPRGAFNGIYWAGRTVTLGGWVYSEHANLSGLSIFDVVGGSPAASHVLHPGDGTWRWLTVTRTLRSGLQNWYVRCRVLAGAVTAYFDGLMLVEGPVCPAHSRVDEKITDNLLAVNYGTYTGNNTANRAIAHSLGTIPMRVVIFMYRDTGTKAFIVINLVYTFMHSVEIPASGTSTTSRHGGFSITVPDSTNFYVGNASDYALSGNGTDCSYTWYAESV